MAAIYCADVYCDECADRIKYDVVDALLGSDGSFDPDGLLGLIDPDDMAEAASGNSRHEQILEIVGYIDDLGGHGFDSDEYPKDCDDDEESDSPQHCGSHAECIDYEELKDGTRVGHFFRNSLTTDGEDYVREAVRDGEEGGVARELWMPEYDYIDFEDDEEEFDEPEEGDITTEDHRRFYQYGKLVLDLDEDDDHEAAVREFMERSKFWPNVWFISDHGNAHLMTIPPAP